VAGTSAEASGLFIATLSKTTGAITARLSRLGTDASFAGNDFRTLQPTSPAVTDGHVASLTLNPTTKHLSGIITEMIGGVAGTVHVIDASKTYDRTTPPTTGVGVYNAAFSAPTSLGTLTAAQHPQGIGYGVLSIGATGTVTVTGLLADGTAWSSSTSLGIDQSISLYGVLRISRSTPVFGALVGTATLDTSAVATDLNWQRDQVVQQRPQQSILPSRVRRRPEHGLGRRVAQHLHPRRLGPEQRTHRGVQRRSL